VNKKWLITGVVVGALLGSTGTGVAATTYYWHKESGLYRCEGVEKFVNCKLTGTGIEMIVSRPGDSADYAAVFRRSKPIYICERQGYSSATCYEP